MTIFGSPSKSRWRSLVSEIGFISRLVLALAALALCPKALAHLVESGQGTVSLSAGKAFVVLSLPMDVFLDSAGNSFGSMDADALGVHQSELARQAMQGIRLSVDGEDAVWTGMALTLAPSKQGQSRPADQLTAVGVLSLGQAPGEVALALTLWRPPQKLSTAEAISHVARPAKEMLKITISRFRDETKIAEEVSFLSPAQPKVIFFAPVHRHIVNFFQHGFDHIMGGADHIVFLVALLASGISLRRWAALLTAFTLAHGLTFALASLAWVSVSPTLVEPAIAASIVIVAALHLLKFRIAIGWELALVFCLGLVHGLGFASAFQDESAGLSLLMSPYPLWSIVGFNLGIEAGQCVVAILFYLAIKICRLIPPQKNDFMVQKFAGICAIVTGTFWLVERII
jgi:hydrogenase/urease accessory protein HupE